MFDYSDDHMKKIKSTFFHDLNMSENFDEILKDIQYLYFRDPRNIITQEVKEYCWKIFEDYAKEYYKIIDVNKPKIYNKYDEDYDYEYIYDKIYDLQQKYKKQIIKENIDKYFEIYKTQQ